VEPVMTATFPVISNKLMSLSPMLVRRDGRFGLEFELSSV
jgi:hypothetical protein